MTYMNWSILNTAMPIILISILIVSKLLDVISREGVWRGWWREIDIYLVRLIPAVATIVAMELWSRNRFLAVLAYLTWFAIYMLLNTLLHDLWRKIDLQRAKEVQS